MHDAESFQTLTESDDLHEGLLMIYDKVCGDFTGKLWGRVLARAGELLFDVRAAATTRRSMRAPSSPAVV
jgi:hypothetical protein